MFHDPIKANPKAKKEKTPWDFEAPCYDDRTSVCAGTHYGSGHKQPVGHDSKPKQFVSVLPQKAKSMSLDRHDDRLKMEE